MTSTELHPSPFFYPGPTVPADSLVILHLRRDHLLPTFLHDSNEEKAGYAEGHVTNTRFGSYPHSTLIGLPWGSQVLASQVDTGSRGRKDNVARGTKRKIEQVSEAERVYELPQEDGEQPTPTLHAPKGTSQHQKQPKAPIMAASGFCHIIPPTPETWTVSLPHRTQVVYTPDYSYILQKLRVRPGSIVIEAGAGSGSFTHAAARAVFNGYPPRANYPSMTTGEDSPSAMKPQSKYGKVYSFEYHEPRAQQLQTEIHAHGLSPIVNITHRDVYTSGFLASTNSASISTSTSTSPHATAVFLDLPAPWLALPHLTRAPPNSPLSPSHPTHLCAFLPCIEQAQRTIAALRTHGWLDITMQALSHRRLDVRRERIGLDLEGLRGVNPSPATVDEAVARLLEVERNANVRKEAPVVRKGRATGVNDEDEVEDEEGEDGDAVVAKGQQHESKAARLARIARAAAGRKTFREGRLVHRSEPEIKTHTSYLVFAVLPVEWSAEEEAQCRARWAPGRTQAEDGEGGERVNGKEKGKGKGKKEK